jgi:hypothetical protein
MVWYDMAIVALHLKNQPEARRSVDRAEALAADLFETLIIRYLFEKVANPSFHEEALLEKAQNADPAKFEAWKNESGATGNAFATLELEEMVEDPFTLPLSRPLSVIEPVTLFHGLQGGE